MTSERITILMPTYGRPRQLEEAIRCFLDQTWPNKRMIVLNDFTDQELIFDHPEVSIVNAPKRICPLGAKRNCLFEMAGSGMVAQWDDDDIYLPNHIASVMGLLPEFRSRAAKQFNCWVDNGHAKYRLIAAQYMHTIIADMEIYRKIGYYKEINYNEDSDLVTRLLLGRQLSGPPWRLMEPTFINRYGPGWAHVTDFMEECEGGMHDAAVQSGVHGRVHLEPQLRADYASVAAASWRSLTQTPPAVAV